MLIDRDFFGGYWLSNDGEAVFGVRPYHVTNCGMVGDQHLLYCLFSTQQLGDPEDGTMQESADMAAIWADFPQDLPEFASWVSGLDIPDSIHPYSLAVVYNDLNNGLAPMDIIELRGFILHPTYCGRYFTQVEAMYPIKYTIIVDEYGNEQQIASHWKRAPEI